MTIKQQIQYWLTTANSDLNTAEDIFNAGRNYHHCLFFCHLALEKGLKALVVKATGKTPPKIHNLMLLSEKANLQVTKSQSDFLFLMNGYNLEARYPDEKLKVYKATTKSIAVKLLTRIKEEFIWM